jgi:hypothetical protein
MSFRVCCVAEEFDARYAVDTSGVGTIVEILILLTLRRLYRAFLPRRQVARTIVCWDENCTGHEEPNTWRRDRPVSVTQR